MSRLKAPVSDRLGPVLEAVRHHVHVIVGQCVGQVGVGRGQRNLNLVFVELLDVGDRLERACAAGLGVTAMQNSANRLRRRQ